MPKASPVHHGGGGTAERWKGRFERHKHCLCIDVFMAAPWISAALTASILKITFPLVLE